MQVQPYIEMMLAFLLVVGVTLAHFAYGNTKTVLQKKVYTAQGGAVLTFDQPHRKIVVHNPTSGKLSVEATLQKPKRVYDLRVVIDAQHTWKRKNLYFERVRSLKVCKVDPSKSQKNWSCISYEGG